MILPALLLRAQCSSHNYVYTVLCKNAFLCTVPGSLSHSELDALVEESLIMSRFDHRNVMKLLGVSIESGNTLYIVMPFMSHGSLLSYLRKHRAHLTIDTEENMDLVRLLYSMVNMSQTFWGFS